MEIPTVQGSIRNYFTPEDLVILGITPNETSAEWLKNYIKEKNITFDILNQADSLFDLYGVHDIPTYVTIDRKGKIRWRRLTYFSLNIGELGEHLQLLIDEK